MTTSRQRILTYLQKHKTVTASELSRALGMTTANARRHLRILEESGVLVSSLEWKGERRGRPAKRYALSRVARGEGIDSLASHLLDLYLDSVSPRHRPDALRRLAERFAGTPSPAGGAMQRLARTIERLNRLGYDARWEAHAEGPRVIFEQCPYAALLPAHPELCDMDEYLLEHLTGSEAHRLPSKERRAPCIFRLP